MPNPLLVLTLTPCCLRILVWTLSIPTHLSPNSEFHVNILHLAPCFFFGNNTKTVLSYVRLQFSSCRRPCPKNDTYEAAILDSSIVEDLPVDFPILGYLFCKLISSNGEVYLRSKPTNGFSSDMNVSKPPQNVYSLVRQHHSSFTGVFDGKLCLA